MNIILFQKPTSESGGDFGQTQIKCGLRERFERKVWFFVHLRKGSNRLFHQSLVTINIHEAIFPDDPGSSQPGVTVLVLRKYKLFSIPDSQNLWCVIRLRVIVVFQRKAKFRNSID